MAGCRPARSNGPTVSSRARAASSTPAHARCCARCWPTIRAGDIVACAVCDAGEIGVDVEFARRERDVEAIARRYFCREEAEWVGGQPEDRFYMLWVLKEAWLKATGKGLAGGLDRLRCRVTPPHLEALAGSASFTALQLYALRGGFLGVAAVDERPGSIEVRRWLPAGAGFAADDEPRLVAAGDPAR